jgi:hypothetical protein
MNFYSRYNRHFPLAAVIGGVCAVMAAPAPALANGFACTAQEVAVFPGSRIHIRCSPGDGAIFYFALSVANPDASRILSLAATAVSARRPLFIGYDFNDTSGTAIGCRSNDCRLIGSLGLLRE